MRRISLSSCSRLIHFFVFHALRDIGGPCISIYTGISYDIAYFSGNLLAIYTAGNDGSQIQEGDKMRINVNKLDSELILALMVLALYLTIMGFVLS